MAGYASRFIVIADFRYCSAFCTPAEKASGFLGLVHAQGRKLVEEHRKDCLLSGFQAVTPANYHSILAWN